MKNKKQIIVLSLVLFILLGLTYSNHFDNDFHFDDFHTITLNPYVQSLENIPEFFTNYQETQSTRPEVKTYRPIVTTMNAISYWLGGGYKPFYFHLTIYIIFIIQLILMFFLFKKIMDISFKHKWNDYIALFATSWYAFHAVNAETINYIIARSDSMSTMLVVTSIVIWAYFPRKRKYGLFLIPAIMAIFTKEPSAMLAPILFFYVIFFEQDMSIQDIFKKNKARDLKKTLIKVLPTLVVLFVITYIVVFVVRVSKEPNYGYTVWEYARTQMFVVFHYFISFFYPYKLSADPDLGVIKSVSDIRMWLGLVFIISSVWLIIKTSSIKKLSPISFGLIWFFLALLPTSSIFVLGQVSNDHRMFFPYVGLVLSVCWALALLLQKYESKIINNNSLKNTVITLAVLILSAHAYGTYQRNKVWDNEKSLWKDTVEKSPGNKRALMNYGVILMREGNLKEAKKLLLKAKNKNYEYSYLMVNLAILYDTMGDNDSSFYYFNKALKASTDKHISYYYFANKLYKDKNYNAAIKNALKSIEVVNHFMKPRHLLMDIYADLGDKKNLNKIAKETLLINKKDEKALYYLNNYKGSKAQMLKQMLMENPTADGFIELSLIYYQNKQYEKVIEANSMAIELDPNSYIAYNNIGVVFTDLGEYDKAIKALNKALELKPDFIRAKNNLAKAKRLKNNPYAENNNLTYEQLLQASLDYYYNEDYEKCIEVCRKAIELRPNSAEAYNNICSAYNKLQEYEKAAQACKKALQIKPDFQRAKNNLNVAKQNL